MNRIYTERTGGYDVLFITHSGMTVPLAEDASREEAQAAIRARICSARRRGQAVSRVGKGSWEFEDDGRAISDRDGFLTVRPTRRRYRRILGRKVYLS
jgi:hypothetical protein